MNKYLLDTHVILWCLSSPQSLSEEAANIIQNRQNELNFSYISLWEIAIKASIGKLKLETSINELIDKLTEKQFSILFPTIPAATEVLNLPFFKDHRDPFDRMLISQAQCENLQIISCDEKFDLYPTIKRIW
jgi:PIN domain nuclease of toxin-antitoxin system